MADQINIPNENFDTLQGTINVYSVAKKTVLGIAPATMITLLALAATWGSFWSISKDKKNSTSIDRENTKAAKAKYIAFLRIFVKQNYYDNPLATNADILAAGLKIHSVGHNLSKVISEEVPAASVSPLRGHLLDVSCMNGSGKKSKPDKIILIRVKWFIGAVVPTNPGLFLSFEDFSRHPIQLQFEAEDAGKPLAIIVCYINSDGSESTYCPVINTIVP